MLRSVQPAGVVPVEHGPTLLSELESVEQDPAFFVGTVLVSAAPLGVALVLHSGGPVELAEPEVQVVERVSVVVESVVFSSVLVTFS